MSQQKKRWTPPAMRPQGPECVTAPGDVGASVAAAGASRRKSFLVIRPCMRRHPTSLEFLPSRLRVDALDDRLLRRPMHNCGGMEVSSQQQNLELWSLCRLRSPCVCPPSLSTECPCDGAPHTGGIYGTQAPTEPEVAAMVQVLPNSQVFPGVCDPDPLKLCGQYKGRPKIHRSAPQGDSHRLAETGPP